MKCIWFEVAESANRDSMELESKHNASPLSRLPFNKSDVADGI